MADENQAICVLKFVYDSAHSSKGIGYFYKINNTTHFLLMVKDINLEYGNLKGVHIHECGDITDGCTSACAHYNPNNTNHGGLNSKIRHYGDLGNVKLDDMGFSIIHYSNIPVDVSKIVGRSLVLHEAEDDLGLGDKRYNIPKEEVARKILKYQEYTNRKVCYHIMGRHKLLAKQLEDKIGKGLTGIRRWDKNPKQLSILVESTLDFIRDKKLESKITGNSGSRIACGIIGYCKPKNVDEMLEHFRTI
jgi:Cu-Zn family superoxide dismutase